jgi:hypothetical protein
MTTSTDRPPPGWLHHLNRINIALLRRGIGVGPQRLLSVPGRTTGILRTTPVALIEFNGKRFVVAGYETADWVKNVRVSGWAIIGRGRNTERLGLTEVPPHDRSPILREFARKVAGGPLIPDSPEASFQEESRVHPRRDSGRDTGRPVMF